LTNSNQKFKQVVKDRLFYDQYQYCLNFHLDEVSCLKELNHQHIDIIIERRREWREISLQRWAATGWHNNKHIVTRRAKEITDTDVEALHTLTDVLLRSRVDFKLITSVSQAWIYTNDLKIINDVGRLEFLLDKQYTQARINRPKNTILLKNPKHRFRSYLKSIKLTQEEKVQLCNFFSNQAEHVRISPALTEWFIGRFHRTQDYFFIDYNEDSCMLLMSLVRPGLIRKTVELIAA
jgi:hypothetical protein